ncbi:hypothetical protein N0V90_006427 [Kalmusia sp. IMI 367209]|nr:hypothetical protein N0V90_006427 [Kalmusia sp. IMI 367209]
MDPQDGRCHIGIPGRASIPFMAVDIVVDVVLTGVFIYLLRPVVKMHGLNKVSAVVGMDESHMPRTEKERNDTAIQKNIRTLLWKSLIGALLIMIPTVANMIQFYLVHGRELALVCLTICTVDVSWDAVIMHWLTFGSAEQERNLSKATESSDLPLKKRASTNSNEICAVCKAKSAATLPLVAPTILATSKELPHPPRLTPSSSHTLSVEYERRTGSSDSILPVPKG